MMEAFGSPVLHKDGTTGLDRDAAIAGITYWADMAKNAAPASAPNDGFRQIIEGFQTGQTAMIYHHTGSYQDIASKLKPGVEFGTMAIPAGPVNRVARLAYSYHTITKPDDADAAWEWVKFWGEPDAAVAFLEKTGYFPASTHCCPGRTYCGQPDVCRCCRHARLRHSATEFPRRRWLGREHRASRFPAGSDRRGNARAGRRRDDRRPRRSHAVSDSRAVAPTAAARLPLDPARSIREIR